MAPADKLIYLANLANGDRRLYVGTHPNKFHLDEVAAIALIRKYYKGPMKVIRSRDWDDLKKCQIVVDVGGKNEITDDHVYFDQGLSMPLVGSWQLGSMKTMVIPLGYSSFSTSFSTLSKLLTTVRTTNSLISTHPFFRLPH